MEVVLPLLPPIISLVLAIWKRKILPALFVGNLVGFIILDGFKAPMTLGISLFEQLIMQSHYQVIIIMLIIAGFVELLDNSGGANAFAAKMTNWINTKSKAMASTMITGVLIFFTDSGNSLILGPLYRPIYDKLEICREKLAYILDSTSSPVCILIPFISWGLYIMGLIESSFIKLGIDKTGFDTFIELYPYQFYPILTLIFGFLMALWGKDFGLMKKYQQNINKEIIAHDLVDKGTKVRFVLMPLGVLFLVMLTGFTIMFTTQGKISGPSLRIVLILAYSLAATFLTYQLTSHKVMSFKESKKAIFTGMKKMIQISIILLLAWTLSDICFELKTADAILKVLSGNITAKVLASIIFLVGVVASFATGSSWGTMAIIMPIAISLGHQIEANLTLCIAAVLSGSLFGDHTSPISDTTLLASMASECEHIDHVKSQMNYALIPGGISLLLFYLFA